MAHGVPVIASRVGALPEIVEDGRTGVLINNDAQSVADALARVLENPDFGPNARARVAEHFTVEEMARGTLTVYRRVLEPRRRSAAKQFVVNAERLFSRAPPRELARASQSVGHHSFANRR